MTPAPLHYAPPIRSKSSAYVIPAGLITSGAALATVWALIQLKDPVNVMGWYADYVIPAGALMVGLAAGSGYGIASWFTGFRMDRRMLAIVVVLQLLSYGVAQYLDFYSRHLVYRHTGQPIGFFDYYHLTTISMAWIPEHGEKAREPLGMWGYGLRALEIIGFAAGGLIIPVSVLKKPYCDLCHVYMKTKKLPTLPGSVPVRKIKKKDPAAVAAYEAEQQSAVQAGASLLDRLVSAAKEGNVLIFNEIVEASRPLSKQSDKLPRRLHVGLAYCKNCYTARIQASVITGRGKKLKKSSLPAQHVPEAFARDFLNKT